MSAKSSWQQYLTEHPLLLPSAFKSSGRHCISQHEGDLFIWRNEEKNLCFVNLKRLQSFAQGGSGDDEAKRDYQTLTCSQVPQFQVTSLKLSPTGQFVALMGEQQVMIMQLPGTRGHMGRFGDGRKEVMCRSFHLAERLLSAGSHVKLLQLRWHSASASETLVLLLTSDSIIRMYCFAQPNKSLQTYAISPSTAGFGDSSLNRSSLYDTTRALSMASAESVMDFDVLPGTSLRSVSGAGSVPDDSCGLFALMDSGDIYMLHSTLPNSTATPFRSRSVVMGPLRMVPAADDNYGAESCSICCLDTHPPAVVVATAEGKLYHCVVIADDSDEDPSAAASATWSTAGPSNDEPMLCVFEGVALGLSEDLPEASEDEAPDVCTNLTLHHVGDATDRYFCSHGSGIHSVTLPWLQRMDRFCVDDGDDTAPIDELNLKDPCHVEHLISSRPFADSPPCPLASFCTITHPFLGNSIVCITDDGVCSSVPLRNPATMAAATPAESTEDGGRPILDPNVAPGPFVDEVRKMLAERKSMPVLRLTKSQQMSEQECQDLLDKSISDFSEHIPVMRKIAATIAKRAKTLDGQRKQQLRECSSVVHQFQEVQAYQAEMDARCKELLQTHGELTKRLNRVFRSLEGHAPVRSIAEEQMADSLHSLSSELKKSQQQLDMVRQKVDFHKAEQSQPKAELSEHHQRTIRSLLKQDTDDIERLVSTVKALQLQSS